MKREKRDPRGQELLREMIRLYQPQSVKDIQSMLKDMFADTMEDMLKAELDTELGYGKNSQLPVKGFASGFATLDWQLTARSSAAKPNMPQACSAFA